MKKFLKIISINLIFFIFLFFVFNWVVFRFLYETMEFGTNSPERVAEYKYTLKRNDYTYETLREWNPHRPPVGLQYDADGILIFGCSYAYGRYLDEKQTLHYKLSDKLKKPVWTFAHPGQAPQFALMNIRTHDFDEQIKKADYAIYVLIGEQGWRVHSPCNGFDRHTVWPRFDNKKGILVQHEYKYPILEESYFVRYLRKRLFTSLISVDNTFIQNFFFDFIKLHFVSIRDELKIINPNIKMIILLYYDRPETALFINNKRWKELEDDGFIIINIQKEIPEIPSDPYQIPNDGHPNELAWEKIVNHLIYKLKLFK